MDNRYPPSNETSCHEVPESVASLTEAEDEDDKTCPICLTDDSPMVRGACGHSFCFPCMERVVNARGEETRWPPQSMSDLHLACPTLGRCPICRASLSLFQLIKTKSGDLLCPPKFNYHQDPNFPLNQCVYIPMRGKVGQLSFHWDWERLKKVKSENTPFLNIFRSLQSNPERWRCANGKLAPKLIFFNPDSCHFHKPSRTFHGTIRWPSRLQGSYEWDIVLGFHPTYRFLSSGRVWMKTDWSTIVRRSSQQDVSNAFSKKSSSLASNDVKEKELGGYPFDGKWTVVWKRKASSREQRVEIQVIANAYTQSGYTFYIDFGGNPDKPVISWPKSQDYQQAALGYVDFESYPMGVKVGEKILWTTTSQSFDQILWIRQTIGKAPLPKVISFGMGQDKMLYQRWEENSDMENTGIPKWHGESLWGNVFCKRLHIGSASYHFIGPEHSYMSYEHPSCSDLTPLDDGTPMPTRVMFSNLNFNADERNLTADVQWEGQFGTSWNDNVLWKLNMWFDSEYMIIVKGGIQCEWCKERRARPRPPRPVNPHRPEPVAVYVPPPKKVEEKKEEESQHSRNEEWKMSGYGHDQLYINAAMLERFRKPDESPSTINWEKIAKKQIKRLRKEGATDRSLSFVSHVYNLAAANPNSNPIDFML